MPQPKFDFKSILSRNLLDPQRHVGTPFTFVHCRDTKQVFFTDAVGNYIDFGSILAAVMNGSLPLALPASPVAGPKGEQGLQGIPGQAGRDGVGWQGQRGEKGERGDVLIPNDSELAAAVIALRSKLAKIQAKILLEISKAKGLHPSHRQQVLLTLKRVQQEITQS
jgi:hypothetical protein